jgi:agmatine deiminase
VLRFDPIPYPLWRRKGLGLARPLLRAFTAADADSLGGGNVPDTPARMADYLARRGILPPGLNAVDTRDALAAINPPYETVFGQKQPASAPANVALRLPAQWERMEAIIVGFPVLYPMFWETHAQMIEAISQVARADVMLPDAAWAGAVWLYLEKRALAKLDNVRLLVLATDDVWVRDYGPFTGFLPDGSRAMLAATYDPLPAYPQANDDSMPIRYAAHEEVPLRSFDLHTEGGNFWSDGAGTLIASEGIYTRNPHLSRLEVERRLKLAFAHDKLIVTPSLWREETGHVDLLCKLADARTILITAPRVPLNSRALRQTYKIFRRATNAAGDPYAIFTLPALPPYLNWGAFPVWRSYTNALTVNGRVLVPVFKAATDDQALGVYKAAMPDHEIIPIKCAPTANGGGAVHCLTKEVPAG